MSATIWATSRDHGEVILVPDIPVAHAGKAVEYIEEFIQDLAPNYPGLRVWAEED